MPTGPKSEIPPKTEKRIKRGGRFILLPTTIGFNILSIVPTITTAQIKRPRAFMVCPVAKRNIIAGIETRPLPIAGTSAVIIATKPQSAGFGTPNNAKPILTNVP